LDFFSFFGVTAGGDGSFAVAGVGGAKRLNNGPGIAQAGGIQWAARNSCSLLRNSGPRQKDRGGCCPKRRPPMTRLHMLSCRDCPQGPTNTVHDSGLVMSAVASVYSGGIDPHTLQSCLTISRMLHNTLSWLLKLTDHSMVSDNFYPQPGMSCVWSSGISSHGSQEV
jgi:hypothetical protein